MPYYRVSTKKQGKSGLGLEAQRKAVQSFTKLSKLELGKAFVEIESGRKNNRPVLADALQHCRRTGALLLIAKLDRLGRNVFFIAQLMEAKVDFIAVDNPKANKFMIHIMAAFAEYERDQISQRTRDALQAAKKRGVILGKYGTNVLAPKNKRAAKKFARKLKPTIQEFQHQGFTTVRALKTNYPLLYSRYTLAILIQTNSITI